MVFGIIFLVGIVIAIIVVFVRKFDPSNPNSVDNTAQADVLQNQLSKETEELKEANAQIAATKSKIEELETKQANWISHIQALQEEVENKNIALRNLEETLDELQEDKKRIEIANKKLEAHIKEQNKYLTASEQLNISNFFAELERDEKIKKLDQMIQEKKGCIRTLSYF